MNDLPRPASCGGAICTADRFGPHQHGDSVITFEDGGQKFREESAKDAVRADVRAAIAEYRFRFPEPDALAANLELAVRAVSIMDDEPITEAIGKYALYNLRAEVQSEVRDCHQIFGKAKALPPNLNLAVRALAVIDGKPEPVAEERPAGKARVTIIVARAENGVIGNQGDIPWHVPADFAHFKATTLGHPIIMGRKTYESIGKPLPGRTTIVVTRGKVDHPDVISVRYVEEAIERAKAIDNEIFVCGGEHVYIDVLYKGLADRLLISEIPGTPEGDKHFDFEPQDWTEVGFSAEDGFDLVVYEDSARTKIMRIIAKAATHHESADGDIYVEGHAGDMADALLLVK